MVIFFSVSLYFATYEAEYYNFSKCYTVEWGAIFFLFCIFYVLKNLMFIFVVLCKNGKYRFKSEDNLEPILIKCWNTFVHRKMELMCMCDCHCVLQIVAGYKPFTRYGVFLVLLSFFVCSTLYLVQWWANLRIMCFWWSIIKLFNRKIIL